MGKVESFEQMKRRKERKAYASLVLKTFDDFNHADRRAYLDKKAEVERVNRQKL